MHIGKYTIMGDADDSYNFLEILPIYNELKKGNDLVIGNRLTKNIENGAMKFTHKYIGTPLLSSLINLKYKTKIHDVNCGLRGFDTKKIQKINLETKGMEFASEMIIKAKKSNLSIKEVDINFYKDKRNAPSNLKTIRDGKRHLKLIFSL